MYRAVRLVVLLVRVQSVKRAAAGADDTTDRRALDDLAPLVMPADPGTSAATSAVTTMADSPLGATIHGLHTELTLPGALSSRRHAM
jgi:hypothetical protein